MDLVPLKTLCVNVTNWNPRTETPNGTFKYIDIASIDRDQKKIIGATTQIGSEAPSRARQLVISGDVLVSTVRPNLNTVALVTERYNGDTASTGFTVLRANPSLLYPKYLFHWVQNPIFVAQMVARATGAIYPAVSDTIVKGSSIPLPPLAEQKHIASILDEAEALRRKRSEAIAKLDIVHQSIDVLANVWRYYCQFSTFVSALARKYCFLPWSGWQPAFSSEIGC